MGQQARSISPIAARRSNENEDSLTSDESDHQVHTQSSLNNRNHRDNTSQHMAELQRMVVELSERLSIVSAENEQLKKERNK